MLPDAIKDRLDELGAVGATPLRVVPTGISEVDSALPGGGLARGKVHEWLGDDTPRWSPPMTLLVELARRAAESVRAGGTERINVVWVGVWPYAAAMVKAGVPLSRCLMVRTGSAADRLWATDLALRNAAVAVVVADGSGLDLSATRRLQLAAEAGGGVCLLARPAREAAELSASGTRWRVASATSPSMSRRWKVQLLRCKGMRHGERVWTVELDHATRAFRVAADVRDGPAEAPARRERLTA